MAPQSDGKPSSRSGPCQPATRHGVFDALDEPIDRTTASLEFSRVEEQYATRVGFGNDHGCLPARCSANRIGLVVAMKSVERHWEPGLAGLPLGPLTNGPVSDFAQRAVPSTEAGTDPIGEFAAHRAVGVVHADKAHDPLGPLGVGGTHRDSIADRVPTAGAVAFRCSTRSTSPPATAGMSRVTTGSHA